jgi:non-specific serine/threonine protein kinase
MFRAMSHMLGIAQCIEILAQITAAEGQARKAALFFGAADAARDALRTPLPPVDRATNGRSIAAARSKLTETAWTAAWNEGGSLTLEEAAQHALAELSPEA